MSREDIPNVLIRLTNVTGFDHTQEANLAFKEATDEIERLLADARKPMECGHPKACLVEREVTNIEKNEGPLNDTEYCSTCAEREKVREMCLRIAESCEVQEETIATYLTRWDLIIRASIANEIRQLDLTAPSSTEEGKR